MIILDETHKREDNGVRIIQSINKILLHTHKTNNRDMIFDVRVTLKAKRKGDRKVIMYDAMFLRFLYNLMLSDI